ncbi:MAG: hypothetical protein HRU20_20125 [Pseudomonadales bacterium]|nr:hypothetical protein [Pseudomonadales bacterium]
MMKIFTRQNLLNVLCSTLFSVSVFAAPPEVSSQQEKSAAPIESEANKTLMLQVAYSDNSYHIIDAWVLNEKLPETKSISTNAQDLVFILKNQSGEMMGQGRINNPNILRGILAEEYDGESHSQQALQESVFVLRYPYTEGMQVLSLMKAENLINQFSSRGKNNAKTAASIELNFSSQLKSRD